MNKLYCYLKKLINHLHQRKMNSLLLKKFVLFLNTQLKDDMKKPFKSRSISQETIVILISPWLGTSVPWYSMMIAFFYKVRGLYVEIIWDDILYYNEGIASKEQQCIKSILDEFVGNFILVRSLSSFTKEGLSELDYVEISRLAKLKVVHEIQTSIPSQKAENLFCVYKESLEGALPYIKGFFGENHNRNQTIIVPGGICANTGLFYWQAKKYNLSRVASYDSGDGQILLGVNDVATHIMDIKGIMDNMDIDAFPDVDYCRKLAKKELELRINGKDRWKTHKVESALDIENKIKYDIFIPLNIEWDSAALGIEKVFHNTYEWLSETIAFILSNTTYNMVIRQHPHEKLFSSNIFLKDFFETNYNGNDRVIFISCNESVNSYSLLQKVKVVLPLSSTIGVEAAMMGKCVIVSSECYYSTLPFVIKCNSKEEYFRSIVKSVENNLTNQYIKEAEICYYFSQCCNWVQTDFTPIPNDFDKILDKSLDELLQDETINNILDSLVNNIPIALFNHEKNMNMQRK